MTVISEGWGDSAGRMRGVTEPPDMPPHRPAGHDQEGPLARRISEPQPVLGGLGGGVVGFDWMSNVPGNTPRYSEHYPWACGLKLRERREAGRTGMLCVGVITPSFWAGPGRLELP